MKGAILFLLYMTFTTVVWFFISHNSEIGRHIDWHCFKSYMLSPEPLVGLFAISFCLVLVLVASSIIGESNER